MRRAPYLDWSLDRWKIGLVVVLFAGLVVASMVEGARFPGVQLMDEAGRSGALAPGVVAGGLVAAPAAEGGVAMPLAAPTPGPVFPLTLATLGPNAIVPEDAVRVLFGTAAAGSLVEVRDQVLPYGGGPGMSPGSAVDVLLGVTSADSDGLWQLELAAPLQPGQHVLSLHQLSDQGQITAVGPPLVVTVLSGGEQGPLSLATPRIRYPYVGARLSPGQVTFLGTGLPGVIIRLYLGNRMVAEGTATTNEEWRLRPAEDLTPGVYVARVSAMNPQGDVIAESAPVVFVVTESAAQEQSWRLPEPSVPLSVDAISYDDPVLPAVVMRGLATPHSSITVWLDGRPVHVTNTQVDGRWQMVVPAASTAATTLEVRSSFGERLQTQVLPGMVRGRPVIPVVLNPQPGQVLTTRRPVVAGLAQPAGDVVVVVNGKVVAEVRSDAWGQWAVQLVDPLPSGAAALSVGARRGAQIFQPAQPVLVTVAPRL